MPSEDQIKVAATAIANARGARAGMPFIDNVLEMLEKASPNLHKEVLEDARVTIEALMTLGTVEQTHRGFEMINFTDAYGVGCSLQQSSAILGDGEKAFKHPGSSAIWLGANEANARVMAKDAASVGVETTEVNGWVDYPIPDAVLCSPRMHLSRDQVKQLVDWLGNWLNSGGFTK